MQPPGREAVSSEQPGCGLLGCGAPLCQPPPGPWAGMAALKPALPSLVSQAV